MSKDYYSGSVRKTSGVRRGVRTRIASPSERHLPPSPEPIPHDADDALSGLLVQRDVIRPRQPKALSNIRTYIRAHMGSLFNRVQMAGETDRDAGNAIRARLGQRMVPATFTLKERRLGRGMMGELEVGMHVRVDKVSVRNKRLVFTLGGTTAGGRPIHADVPGDEIGDMF
jgi:hypothetical protein